MTCERGCCSTQAEHYRSVGLVGKNIGKPRVGITRTDKSTVIETQHWDGRQDAIVRPATIRYGGRVHNTGVKKGEVAEIAPMAPKERKARYGEQI